LIREERRIYPNAAIVAMSGITGRRDMLPVAKHLGACQTLRKPFSKADLLDAVAAALNRRPGECPAAPPDASTSGLADARSGRPAGPPHSRDKL
jgi:FixJ family two-component response regulator